MYIYYKTFNTNINEKYLNLFYTDISKHIDEIWNLLMLSYKDVEGGFATAENKNGLINKNYLCKCEKKNGTIISCVIYSDKNGRKIIAAATDGSEIGKQSLYKILVDDIKLNRSYGEYSGKLEHIMLKKYAIPIPNIYVSDIIKKEIELDDDGYHYYRIINGNKYRKILLSPSNFLEFFKK